MEENELLSLFDDKDWKMYKKNKSRKFIPICDDQTNEAAIERLAFLKENYRIPKRYLEKWHSVKLFNAKGETGAAYAIFLDETEGTYDVRNKLNDLTGKEWTKFTCSWFIFNALSSDLKEEREITKEAQSHPATYSPTMAGEFIKFFTKEGETVLDPFLGIGSTLVGCLRNGRIGYGTELNLKYYEIAKLRAPVFENNIFNWDATKLDELDLPEINFSISSPPYWDVLNRSTDGFEKSRKEKGLDISYSDNENDLGNISDYNEFLEQTAKVYIKMHKFLKTGAYVVIIIKNVKKGGKLYPLAWDLAKSFHGYYELKDEKLWIQDKIGLSPYGYPNSWASNILHHYCLIFRKERNNE